MKPSFIDIYKLAEHDADDFVERVWPKRSPNWRDIRIRKDVNNMHTRQEYINRIMYGDGEHAYCSCKSINYSDYCKHDVEQTKEVAERMNKTKRNNDPRMNYNTGNIYVVINGKAYIPETINMRTGFREHTEIEFSVSTDPSHAAMNTMLAIKDVIHNPPATIVFWGDGSKTVVKCQDGEEYDPEKGLTMAFFKRMHDNKGHYFEEIKKWNNKYAMSQFKDEVHTMKDERVANSVERGISKESSNNVCVEFSGRDFLDILKQISEGYKLIADVEKYHAEHDSDNK